MGSPIEVRFAETRWQPINPPRTLTQWERTVLDLLLAKLPSSEDSLRCQSQSVRVSAACTCCLSIVLTSGQEEPRRPSNVHHGHVDMAMEAECGGSDEDGVPFWALLFTQGGNLAEMEIQRADGTPFKNIPGMERFEY